MVKKNTPHVVVDAETYAVLKTNLRNTGVPMARQIKFHVLGKAAKVKKVFD